VSVDSYSATPGEAEKYTSPFAGLSHMNGHADPGAEAPAEEHGDALFEAIYYTESPFGAESDSEADVERETQAVRDFLETLHDEEFEDALEQLLNEGAARVLADAQEWSAAPTDAGTREALDEWIAPLMSEWEHSIDSLGGGLENTDLTRLSEQELDELLDSLEPAPTLGSEVFDNFLGKLLRKAKSFIKEKVRQAGNFIKNPVKGVIDLAKSGLQTIKSGIQTIGKHLIGPILNRLKGIGLALLKGVVKKLAAPLTRLLPSYVRPAVKILMTKLGLDETSESPDTETDEIVGSASVLAEAFDTELVSLLYSPESGMELGDETGEFDESEYVEPELDEAAGLDDARARLATALSEHTGTEPPTAEIEQFLPVVLAIRPLLKLGLKLTGARGKLINLIATPLANLIKGMVGPEAARLIAKAGVDVGFTALGLETSPQQEQTLSGEALASTVEATAMEVLDEISDEALDDPLQVSASVQRAFSRAAAAYLPDRLLRADLPERESAGVDGYWILMPRSMRPRYRFRKYSQVFAVPITRQQARAVRWSDGGTMETYLLDRGVDRWPVQAEIDLYETLPGTIPGHFTRDEALPASEHPADNEFQPLTEEAAGLLLREPGLGRAPLSLHRFPRAQRPLPGQRYFRIRVGQLPARKSARPRRLLVLDWDPAGRRLRIAIRLSERRARALLASIQRSAPSGQRDLPAVLSELRAIYLPHLTRKISRRLLSSSLVNDPTTANRVAAAITASTSTAISKYLVQRGAQLGAAVADPASGVTITVTFTSVSGNPAAALRPPNVSAKPGWHHV
jgi:hypothetical protein